MWPISTAILFALVGGCASIAPGIHSGYFADARVNLRDGLLHPRPDPRIPWPYTPHPAAFGYQPSHWTPWPEEPPASATPEWNNVLDEISPPELLPAPEEGAVVE
jgi:hypothetical protein